MADCKVFESARRYLAAESFHSQSIEDPKLMYVNYLKMRLKGCYVNSPLLYVHVTFSHTLCFWCEFQM